MRLILHKNKLGDLGEKIAIDVISRPQNGFVNVRNLNVEHPNHPYVDLYAERDGEKYVISVKTRRKYRINGKLNDNYNLVEKSKSVPGEEFELVKEWANKYNAIAAWAVIAGEASVFSVYFGFFASIQDAGRYSIPMKPTDLIKYECLAENEPHQYSEFSREEAGVTIKPNEDVFAIDYPNITAWVEDGGLIEVGTSHATDSFIRALNGGGIVWQDGSEYPSMDAAFEALEAGIAAFLQEQGIKL